MRNRSYHEVNFSQAIVATGCGADVAPPNIPTLNDMPGIAVVVFGQTLACVINGCKHPDPHAGLLLDMENAAVLVAEISEAFRRRGVDPAAFTAAVEQEIAGIRDQLAKGDQT